MVDPKIAIDGIEEYAKRASPIVSGYAFRTIRYDSAIGLRFTSQRHGGRSDFLSHRELAQLLTREDIDRIDAERRRQQRHSGVESLDDINERHELDDYVELD